MIGRRTCGKHLQEQLESGFVRAAGFRGETGDKFLSCFNSGALLLVYFCRKTRQQKLNKAAKKYQVLRGNLAGSSDVIEILRKDVALTCGICDPNRKVLILIPLGLGEQHNACVDDLHTNSSITVFVDYL